MARLSALIIGGANTLEADRREAERLFSPDLIIGCNHAARDEPGRIDHFVSMHGELIPKWLEARRKFRRPEPGAVWHARHRPCLAEGARPIESWGGSSGLLCVAVAWHLGVERIVLAGIPMVKTARHYDDERYWNEARQYWPAWERRQEQLRERVRSMSGWTRDLLGPPTEAWLNG